MIVDSGFPSFYDESKKNHRYACAIKIKYFVREEKKCNRMMIFVSNRITQLGNIPM